MSRAFGKVLLAAVVALTCIGVGDAAAQRHRPPPSGPRHVRCESEARRHEYCRTWAYGRVRLVERLSKSRCRQYDTWGADRDGGGVWVRDGCRAIFVVDPYDRPGPGYRPPHGPSAGYRITCRSDRFRPTYCPLPRWGRARLEKRLSDAPCWQYDTWGSDGGGIWVDRGCAAVFFVR